MRCSTNFQSASAATRCTLQWYGGNGVRNLGSVLFQSGMCKDDMVTLGPKASGQQACSGLLQSRSETGGRTFGER
jgi:hypothetical protein